MKECSGTPPGTILAPPGGPNDTSVSPNRCSSVAGLEEVASVGEEVLDMPGPWNLFHD